MQPCKLWEPCLSTSLADSGLGTFAICGSATTGHRAIPKVCSRGVARRTPGGVHRGSYEGRALGDDRFVEQVLSRAAEPREVGLNLDRVIGSVWAVYQLTAAELRSAGKEQPAAEARAVAAYLVRKSHSITLSELAVDFRRDLSGLSQAARRIERRVATDEGLRRKLAKVEEGMEISVCQA